MSNKCCFCGITDLKSIGKSLHRFPLHNASLLEEWIRNMNVVGFTPKEYHRLCSQHFDKHFFEENTTRLKENSIPTKFLDPHNYCVCCRRKRTYKSQCSFYHFPLNNPKLLSKWLEKLGIENWTPTKDSLLCAKHFEDSCFRRDRGKYFSLRGGSIPTIIKIEENNSLNKQNINSCTKELSAEETTPVQSPVSISRRLVNHDHKYENSPRSLRREINKYQDKLKNKNHTISLQNRQIIQLKRKVASLKDIIENLRKNQVVSENSDSIIRTE